MANTITKQVLNDGERNAVVKWVILGDNSGDEAATLFLDVSADLTMGERTEVKITRVIAAFGGFAARLLWDATTDVTAINIPDGDTDHDFRDIGGLRNNSGSGKTGDINITTVGLGTEVGTIVLYMKKVEGARKV